MTRIRACLGSWSVGAPSGLIVTGSHLLTTSHEPTGVWSPVSEGVVITVSWLLAILWKTLP
jgi:hypothetical protein